MNRRSTRLAASAALLVAGALAGTQLGKVAPLVGWYQSGAGFSLVQVGWFAALIGLFVALLSLPAGMVIERFGLIRSFHVSALLLSVGGVALAFAPTPVAMIAARLVEAAGYLLLVVAVPALLASVPPREWAAPALAVWGGFVPVGFAVANYLADAMLPAWEPPAYLLACAVLFTVAAMAASLLLVFVPAEPKAVAAAQERAALGDTLSVPVVLVALAFGVYVVLSIGFFTFFPAYAGSAMSAVALSAGSVALIVPLGNLAAGALVRGRDQAGMARLALLGFVAMAAAAVPAFGEAPFAATVGAVAFALAGGISSAVLFAIVPPAVPRLGSVAVAMGLIAQAGGICTLFGAPLAGWVIERWGWGGFGLFLAGTSLLGVACLVPLARLRR